MLKYGSVEATPKLPSPKPKIANLLGPNAKFAPDGAAAGPIAKPAPAHQ